jgi:hypothetical protein
MARIPLTALFLVCAACSTARSAGLAPRAPETAAVVLPRSERTYADADRSPAPPASEPSSPFEPVSYRSVVQVVELPAASPEYLPQPFSGYGDEGASQPPPSPRSRRDGLGWFPVNAAVGAGVGAIIGHQSGRRGRGALIGSGIGFLFDLARWR